MSARLVINPVVASPAIKFCGLTRPEDVALAEELGASFVGAIRAGGPRLLTRLGWRDVLGSARASLERVAVLGTLTVPALLEEAEALAADIVQWHGDPTPDDVRDVQAAGVRVWPVLRIAGTELPPLAWELADGVEALVLDAKVTGQLGGTGVALDWSALAAQMRRWRADNPDVALVLAGGLHPGNVQEAITLLGPDVVDVSSGVELAPGIKDPERMRAFVDAVRGRN